MDEADRGGVRYLCDFLLHQQSVSVNGRMDGQASPSMHTFMYETISAHHISIGHLSLSLALAVS
jgi:hypothetical protein